MDAVLADLRLADKHVLLVVLNLGSSQHTRDLSETGTTAPITVASDMRRAGTIDLAGLVIGPDEEVVMRLD